MISKDVDRIIAGRGVAVLMKFILSLRCNGVDKDSLIDFIETMYKLDIDDVENLIKESEGKNA